MENRFISAIVPAIRKQGASDSEDENGGGTIVTTQWPMDNNDPCFVTNKMYHHVYVIFNCTSVSGDRRHICGCTCRFNQDESGNLYRRHFGKILSYAVQQMAANTSSTGTWQQFDNFVVSLLGSQEASIDIFGESISSPGCLDCIHTKVKCYA